MKAVGAPFALASFRWSLLGSTALGLLLASVPLFGVHGVESAVVLGALLPPLCAAVGARAAIAARGGEAVTASVLAGRALYAGFLLLAAPVLVLGLNSLRVRNCAPLEGLAFIALGPGCGVALAALAGASLGALPLRPWLTTTAAALLPLADATRALYDFYATPAVYAYGHFFGYFPGSLYDELIELPGPLLTLRLLTATACVALLCMLGCFYDPTARRLRAALRPQRRAALGLLGISALTLLLGYGYGEELGHRTSVGYIAEVLGGRELSARCDLLLPRELRRSKRRRLAADCDFRVRQLERVLGLRQPGRIRVLVFRSAQEKHHLMGAADTNIAKPWRKEIYLQDDAWPHPVLPHELAHILAGNVGRGPLRIAGRFLGLWPDFALIEGTAVAAAWQSSLAAGLTPHQWTRAMYELGLAPPLQALFGTGFLGQQTRLAYTLSGSLLRYIADTRGKAAVRQIYQRDDLAGVLGVSLPELERGFRAYVMSVPLPEPARALAKLRFEGSSILSSVCPHEKAKLHQELDGFLSADDDRQAAHTCERLLAIDPAETGVRATLVGVLARRGQSAAAERELARLEGPLPAAPPTIASARQLLADEAWRRGDLGRASTLYGELLALPNDRDSLRMLQVKALALQGSARQRELLLALLVGEPGQSIDGAVAVHLVRELRAERKDGLPHYLEARQLYMRERFAEASRLLEQARKLGLPTREIALEALRLAAICSFATGELATSAALWRELGADNAELGQRADADDWLERVADAQASHH
jgi:hypothetical protein